MTERFMLKKDHLAPFLARLVKEYRLVAPAVNRFGDTLFTELTAPELDRLDLDRQPQSSAKSFLLPQRETLFTYRSDAADNYAFAEENGMRPTVFFGLRSCDLSAILYMDVIFQSAADPYYRRRRQNSILISLGCNTPFANCFCLATRNGPFLESGFDLQFTDLGDSFCVEAGRSRGLALIRQWRLFFEPASKEASQLQYQTYLESRGRFSLNVPVEQAIALLRQGRVPEQIYEELSLRCQDCGGCAYICPTCTCFTITDRRTSASEGERIRSWDACTFAGFSRMAGGHNPVDQQQAKIKRRFLHKLLHDADKHRRPSCVGCGRCVDMCFGGVDIVRFIRMVCEAQ